LFGSGYAGLGKGMQDQAYSRLAKLVTASYILLRRGPMVGLLYYDSRGELLTDKRYANTNVSDTSSPVTGRRFTFAFDPIGNRKTYQVDANSATSYTSNDLDQYTATTHPTQSLAYDADGNMTSDGVTLHGWDAENRRVSDWPVSLVSGSTKTLWTYDYLGRMVRRQSVTWNGSSWGAVTFERSFLYDGWNHLEVLDGLSSDAITRVYTWGLDLSGLNGNNMGGTGVSPVGSGGAVPGMHSAGGIGGLLSEVLFTVTPTGDYLHMFDANGNVSELLSLFTGGVAGHYEYDPYGKVVVSNGSDNHSVFFFSTKFMPDDTYYFENRWLWPAWGRWGSRDPIEEQGGDNLYAFVRNSPIGPLL
jgi:RHS repeat-associated protein